MQHTTKTFCLAAALLTTSVAALAAARSIGAKQQTAPLSSRNNIVATPLLKTVSVDGRFRNRNPEFQKELDEANKRSFVADKKAQQLFEEGRLAEAEQACYDALSVSFKVNGDPTDMIAQQLLGDVYREQGRYKEAIEVYRNSLKHGIGDDAVPLNIAWCYLKLDDLKNAHQFYSEEKFFADLPAKRKADYFSMLPGDKMPKTMEASLLYALGCVKSSHAESEKAIELWKKTLKLVPQNALAAWWVAMRLDFLGKRDEAVPYWARAAVFGKGDIADDGHRELNNHLMPDKREQALRDARKIKG
jgi:tetratricopeptide (TPR) repeat protein